MNLTKTLLFLAAVAATAIVNAGDGKTKALPCGACHGADGNSTLNPEWPNLAGQHADYMVQQLKAFKDGTRKNPNMSGMAAALSEEDMLDIATYFSGQSLNIASTESSEAVTLGEKLYRGGNHGSGVPACMACHGPNGAGNPGAKYPVLRGQHAKYIVLQLNAYKAGERVTDNNEVMRAIAGRMSAAEIDNVAKFLQGLH